MTSFGPSRSSVGTPSHCCGEPEVVNDERDEEAAADAAEHEPPLIVCPRRARPCTGFLGSAAVQRGLGPATEISGLAEGVNPKLDPGGRLAGQIDQLASDDLLGLQSDLGCGLLGVRVERGPAEAEPGGRGQGIDSIKESDRRGPRGIQPEAAIGVGAAATEKDRRPERVRGAIDLAGPPDDVDNCSSDRLARRVEHASHHEHPARGGTPVCVIRLRGDRA